MEGAMASIHPALFLGNEMNYGVNLLLVFIHYNGGNIWRVIKVLLC